MNGNVVAFDDRYPAIGGWAISPKRQGSGTKSVKCPRSVVDDVDVPGYDY